MIDYRSDKAILTFIQDHIQDDPDKLVLQRDKYPDIPIAYVATQISARQKSRIKLPFIAQHPSFQFPSKLSYEQCSSELTARYKSSFYKGSSFLDLTGGLGIDSYHIAKQFSKGVYIEQEASIAEFATHNFNTLGAKNINIVHSTAEAFLKSNTQTFDLIYLDPARRDEADNRVFKIEDCTPNVLSIINDLLNKADYVLWKTAPLLDIKMVLKQLKTVFRVDVVAVENEVKEVLYHLKSNPTEDPEVHTINLPSEEAFSFKYSEESSVESIFSEPEGYLYEPNSAILKAGGFKSIGQRYDLKKLHPNTHLYTGNQLIHNFPGRKFRILQRLSPNKKSLLPHIPEMKANISSRNYPLTVEQLRKKTGLADGGSHYIFATQDIRQRKLLLLTEKLNSKTVM